MQPAVPQQAPPHVPPAEGLRQRAAAKPPGPQQFRLLHVPQLRPGVRLQAPTPLPHDHALHGEDGQGEGASGPRRPRVLRVRALWRGICHEGQAEVPRHEALHAAEEELRGKNSGQQTGKRKVRVGFSKVRGVAGEGERSGGGVKQEGLGPAAGELASYLESGVPPVVQFLY